MFGQNEGNKEALVRALEQHILNGPATAPLETRRNAFDNSDLHEPLAVLVDKVARRSFQVTDADFEAAAAAGFTEDQLFEVVICAAVGAASRQYQAGLAALAEASA
jgi:alkylhydroperoxidase/carboxymuconolactone decarboxylase family protein YurZ